MFTFDAIFQICLNILCPRLSEFLKKIKISLPVLSQIGISETTFLHHTGQQ